MRGNWRTTGAGKTKRGFFSISDDSTVETAIKKMKQNNISQIPVYAENELVGVVTESEMLRSVFDGTLNMNDNLSVFYKRNFSFHFHKF